MAFKIKATLVEFMGDEKSFPCHFCYKIGDSFIYDGEEFQGRVCPGIRHQHQVLVDPHQRESLLSRSPVPVVG